MIISWFTQPPDNAFSSYYQYDTVTGEFSRVRLELGRTSITSTNDTFVSYYPKRFVGFSDEDYPSPPKTKTEKNPWTVNDKGQLCYDKDPLQEAPASDYFVYDTSDPTAFVHYGNPVTTRGPVLPTGIEAKHLTLLANDAIIRSEKFVLTDGSAKPEQLVEAIKAQVCRVLKVDKFRDVNDDMIIDKLKSQAETMRDLAAHESVFNMDKALTAADDTRFLISEQIEEGLLTPNRDFADAFTSLQEAITKAQDVSGDNSVETLAEISNAQIALNTAIENIDTEKYAAVARELGRAADSLGEAEAHAADWRSVEMEYKALTEADTVDEYMEYMESADPMEEGGF